MSEEVRKKFQKGEPLETTTKNMSTGNFYYDKT